MNTFNRILAFFGRTPRCSTCKGRMFQWSTQRFECACGNKQQTNL